MSTALARIDFDKEQIAVIESQFFPSGASKAEQAYCFSVARELCLNPITKEIFFVNRRQKIGDKWFSKVEPMVGRDGFLSIAHRSNQFAGIETTSAIREIPQLEEGKWGFKQQLVAECTVWRKDSDRPFTAQVAYNEYCQRTAEGNPTKFWAEKPETMLKKVAESQALRKAFNIHGVYCPEEVGAGFELANGEIIGQTIEADCTRIEATDKSHQANAKPPQIETKLDPPPVKRRSMTQPPEQPDPHFAAPLAAPVVPPLAPLVVPPVVPTPPPVVPTHVDSQHPDFDEYEDGYGDPDDDGWPDPPSTSKLSKVVDDVALQVIDLLEGKKIEYEVILNGINGIISANSYDRKEFLKSSGFRWSSDTKRWIYKFTNESY